MKEKEEEEKCIQVLIAQTRAVIEARDSVKVPKPYHKGVPADGWACECDRCLPTRTAEQARDEAVEKVRNNFCEQRRRAQDALYRTNDWSLERVNDAVKAAFPPHTQLEIF